MSQAKTDIRSTAPQAKAATTTDQQPSSTASTPSRLGNQQLNALLQPAWHAERDRLGQTFGANLSNVPVQIAAPSAPALGYTDGASIGLATRSTPERDPAARRTLAHEVAHVVQLRGGNHAHPLARVPNVPGAEAQASAAAQLALRGQRPQVSAFSHRGVLYDKPGARDEPVITGDEEAMLDSIDKSLPTLPDGPQRSDLIEVLVLMAIRSKETASVLRARRMVNSMVEGRPVKRISDHMVAMMRLQEVAHRSRAAWDMLLHGRFWFADKSQDEIGSGYAVSAFETWLKDQRGKTAVEYLRQRVSGPDKFVANLAARVIGDLLARQSDPANAKYKANFEALRSMARQHGWAAQGALGVAAFSTVVFDALAMVRDQVEYMHHRVKVGPIYDQWEDDDLTALADAHGRLGQKGPQTKTTASGGKTLVFTAANREETEHALLLVEAEGSAKMLEQLARACVLAADAGARIQERTAILHANAATFDQLLGWDAAKDSDERKALFDVRHEYIKAWLTLFTGDKVFTRAGETDVGDSYARVLAEADQSFERFDQAVGRRKWDTVQKRFSLFTKQLREGNARYEGNKNLDEKYFFTMREELAKREESLSKYFTNIPSIQTSWAVIRIKGSGPQKDHGSDLSLMVGLERDVMLYGLQTGVFLLYATNLTLHTGLVKADLGKGFTATQAKRLIDMRTELAGFYASGDFDGFVKKADGYETTFKDVVEKIKDKARANALIQIAITVVAALLSFGAGLLVRMAALGETLALVRTARLASTLATMTEIGVFTAAQMGGEKLAFGKDITAVGVVKNLATNLAFMGALKLVGKFAEPLAKGSQIRQLFVGHLAGFSGVAGVSAVMTKVETGQWPQDLGMFLTQTAATYLLIAGLHKTFDSLVAKPALRAKFKTESAKIEAKNQLLMDELDTRVNAGTLTDKQFEALRTRRLELIDDARVLARQLKDFGALSTADATALDNMAARAEAEARAAKFPEGMADDTVRALPAPDNVIELTRVGDSNVWAYDPSGSRAGIDTMLARYQDKGFKVQGSGGLTSVVDPSGRTRFLLKPGPGETRQLFLPKSSGPPSTMVPDLIQGVTGKTGAAADAVRVQLSKINGRLTDTLVTEYPEHTAMAATAMLLDHHAALSGWPIDAVRGVADMMALERGVTRAAVRNLFLALDNKALAKLFSQYHDIVNSSNVSPGSRFLVAEDLRPTNSARLIDAYRKLQSKGIELPPDMDRTATRGLLRSIDKDPNWLGWLSKIHKDKRAMQLRAKSGLVNPQSPLPENVQDALAIAGADIPGYPDLNPLRSNTGEDYIRALEAKLPAGQAIDPIVRVQLLSKVDSLRQHAGALQQNRPLDQVLGNLTGDRNEINQISLLLLQGNKIHTLDRTVGLQKGQKTAVQSVDVSALALPGGGKVKDAPMEAEVHLDVLMTDLQGQLVTMELTTMEWSLPEPWAALDPQHPNYGTDISWKALNPDRTPGHRKWQQAVKTYVLNKLATAIGAAFSGGPAKPAIMRIRAKGYSVEAARALEALGFQLELTDGSRVTAASIAALKGKGSGGGP